ncbi:MAG: hypothetical protein JRJ85_12145 [Deltaproteobacteria bacterium]|nr:hypothetical protein [Deltaproteobacteria bacterium]
MDSPQSQIPLPLSEHNTSRFKAGKFRRKESVKEACKRALAECGLSREEFAVEISRLTGDDVSIHSLNNYIAGGKADRRLPAEYLEAFAAITGDNRILEAAIQNHKILSGFEITVYEYGAEQLEKIKLQKREKKLRARLGI